MAVSVPSWTAIRSGLVLNWSTTGLSEFWRRWFWLAWSCRCYQRFWSWFPFGSGSWSGVLVCCRCCWCDLSFNTATFSWLLLDLLTISTSLPVALHSSGPSLHSLSTPSTLSKSETQDPANPINVHFASPESPAPNSAAEVLWRIERVMKTGKQSLTACDYNWPSSCFMRCAAWRGQNYNRSVDWRECAALDKNQF